MPASTRCGWRSVLHRDTDGSIQEVAGDHRTGV